MADERLRRLERRATDGDLEARARLLRERVRAGRLKENALDILAAIGHQPACIAVAREMSSPDTIEQLVSRLSEFKLVVLARAAWAAAHFALLPVRRSRLNRDNTSLVALESVRLWTEAPPQQRKQAKARIIAVNPEFCTNRLPPSRVRVPREAAYRAAWCAARMVTQKGNRARHISTGRQALEFALRALILLYQQSGWRGNVRLADAEQMIVGEACRDLSDWLLAN